MMTHIIKFYMAAILMTAGIIFSGIVHASPMADLTFTETDLGGGSWQYDYTMANTSDPVTNPGAVLYDVWFSFNSSYSITSVTVPTGWDSIWDKFSNVFNVFSFPPPDGADIAPGSQPDGFRFIFTGQVGPLAFEALFVNPEDVNNPSLYEGTSRKISGSNPVPEPAAMVLFWLGLLGLTGIRRLN